MFISFKNHHFQMWVLCNIDLRILTYLLHTADELKSESGKPLCKWKDVWIYDSPFNSKYELTWTLLDRR